MGLFGGKGGSRPPDPMQSARTQMDLNRDVMRQNALYSQIGQRTPFAQTYYTGQIGGPDRQQHTQFHPIVQALLFGGAGGGGLFGNMMNAAGVDAPNASGGFRELTGGQSPEGTRGQTMRVKRDYYGNPIFTERFVNGRPVSETFHSTGQTFYNKRPGSPHWNEPIPHTPQEFLAEEAAERDAKRRSMPSERSRSGGGSSSSDSEDHQRQRSSRNMGHSSRIQGAGRRSGQGRGLADIMAGSGDRTRTAHLQGGKRNVLTGNTPRHRANIAGQIVDAITGNDRKSRTTRSDRRNASRKSRSGNSRSRGGGGKGGSR